jgi:hypothetical protein
MNFIYETLEMVWYFTYQYLYFILLIIILIAFFKAWKPSVVHAHWNHLIGDFKFSTQDFYSNLEKILSEQNISGLSCKQVKIYEGIRFLSSKRLYLRIIWKDKIFDVCAAPFANGFFLSWWLFEKEKIWQKVIGAIPFLGKWIINYFSPITYYKLDTAAMFQSYVHSSVLNLINEITTEKNYKLSESERKPVLEHTFKR